MSTKDEIIIFHNPRCSKSRQTLALLRAKEAAYKESGLSRESSANDIVQAIAENPVLLERPVVVRGDQAAIGRPPENVLPLLK